MYASSWSWCDCGPNSSCGIESRDLAEYKSGGRTNTCWHNNMGNYLFADGHVKWYPASQLPKFALPQTAEQ